MADLARFPLDDGGSVLVEIEPVVGTTRLGKREDLIEDARTSFDKALSNVRGAATAALTQFRSMSQQPTEVEIKFGVKLTAEAGAIIAKTGLEGTLEVTLRWKQDTAAT